MTYIVDYQENNTYEIEVNAESENEAYEKAMEIICDGESIDLTNPTKTESEMYINVKGDDLNDH